MQRKTVHISAGRSLTHPENASRAIPHSRNRAAKQLLVACLVLFMVLVPALGLINPVFAWVSLDINPSIEFAINPALTVIRANGLNADARQLMLDGEYIGLPLDQSVRIFLKQAEEAGYQVGDADHPLIIDAGLLKLQTRIGTGGKNKSSAALTAMLKQMKSQFSREGINAVVRMEPSDVRNEARKLGLSIGRYTLMEMAKESGVELSPEESRTMQLSKLMSLAGKKLAETSLTVEDEGTPREPDASLNDSAVVQPADTMKNNIETTSAGGISSNGTQEKERNATQERNELQEQNVGTSNELTPVQNKEKTQLEEQQNNAEQSVQATSGSATSAVDATGSASVPRASSSETIRGQNDSDDAIVQAPENGNGFGETQEQENSSSPAEQPPAGNSGPAPTIQPPTGNGEPTPTIQPPTENGGPSPTIQPPTGNGGSSPSTPATEIPAGPSDTGNGSTEGDR
jgi:hypothetical protein